MFKHVETRNALILLFLLACEPPFHTKVVQRAADDSSDDGSHESDLEDVATAVFGDQDELLGASFVEGAVAGSSSDLPTGNVSGELMPQSHAPADVAMHAVASSRAPSSAGGSSALGPRDQADACLVMDSGTIRFYRKHGRFQATCSRHPQCRLTRYLGQETPANTRKGKGRPLGLMAAWLQDTAPIDEIEHKSPLNVMAISRMARMAARDHLKTLEQGRRLLEFERPCGEGCPEEPE